MFGHGKKNTQPVYGALIDIGSGTIGIAIVKSDISEKFPQIIYAFRNSMRVGEQSEDRIAQLRRVQESLLSTALILSGEGMQALSAYDPHAKISKINVTCSSPWSYTVSKSGSHSETETFRITAKMINAIIEDTEREILENIQKESSVTSKDLEIVEHATLDISVNDYPVHDPITLKGTDLRLTHIVGLVPKEILATLKEIQDKMFPHAELRVHTYMLIMYCIMRDVFPQVHALCLVDVTGEATEFGIIENDLLIENNFISYGSNTFLRDVVKKTEKPHTDVLSHLQAYDADVALEPADFKEHMQLYEAEVKTALLDILERCALPSHIVLTAHHPFKKIFKHVLENALESVTEKKIPVTSLDENVLPESKNDLDADVYLVLGARFFHKLHGCTDIND